MNRIVIRCGEFTVIIETESETFARGWIASALCRAAGEAFSGGARIAIERSGDADGPFPSGADGGDDDLFDDYAEDGWELPGGDLEDNDL